MLLSIGMAVKWYRLKPAQVFSIELPVSVALWIKMEEMISCPRTEHCIRLVNLPRTFGKLEIHFSCDSIKTPATFVDSWRAATLDIDSAKCTMSGNIMNLECEEDVLQEALSVCKRLVNSPKFSNCLKVLYATSLTEIEICSVVQTKNRNCFLGV